MSARTIAPRRVLWNTIADGLYLVRQRHSRLCGEPVLRHALGARRPDGQVSPGNPKVPEADHRSGGGFQILVIIGKDPITYRARTYKLA
jgi:hypothetical protein